VSTEKDFPVFKMVDPVVCPKCGRTIYNWVKAWNLKKEGGNMALYECPYCRHRFRKIIKTPKI